MQLSGLSRLVVASTVALSLFTSQANASLITNGSFEDNIRPANSWTVMEATKVPGWSGSNIEIWHGLQGVNAADGKNHIELNADGANNGSWFIFQNFATVVGQDYQLSFAYRARTGTNLLSSEAFRVDVGSLSQVIDDHVTGNWRNFSGRFTAQANQTTLRFTSLNTGTVGNFLDNVVVVSATPNNAAVPLTPTLGFLAMGLLGFMLVRRQRD